MSASPSLSIRTRRSRSTGESEESGGSSSRAGGSIGSRAGGVQSTELAELHATATSLAPAAIRPDPDTVVRRLLLQYREEGATVARQIGEVEQFRRLLGGATEDFSVTAQVTYDATSLLAKLKVAETVCEGLVAPNGTAHPGWTSILPAAPDQSTTNLTFLAQRILGIPSEDIPAEVISSLTDILNASLMNGEIINASYIPVCAALVIDASALLL